MARKKNRPATQARVENPFTEEVARQLTITTRLSPCLNASAKSCAENCGVSLNALISIALASYLFERGYPVHS